MPFRNDGEGLHRSVDPADGKHYVYGMSFMDAAPDDLRLLRPARPQGAVHLPRPRARRTGWSSATRPGEQVEPGVWEFEQSQPLSTYFVTLVAGPYHVIRDEHDGIPLGLSARASIAADLDKDADELFTLTRQSFDELHRLFGIRYPFGDYHQAFVPEFNAGAMENPGCVTFRDPLVFTSRVTRGHPHRPGQHHRPRDGAPVVRQPRHAGVVGRPVAQRVVRRVPRQPGHRRRHGVRRRVGRQRLRAPPVGAGRRPAAEHPPGRRQRRGRRRPRRCRTSTASPTPRAARSCASSTPPSATRCSSRAPSTTSSGTGSATRPCTTCSRAGSAPAPATCRASPTTGCARPAPT